MAAIGPRMTPVSFQNVVIDDLFWSQRIRTNREVTLPIEYEQCKKTGRIGALRLKWKPGNANPPHIFWDSDVAKWVEAAACSLTTHPSSESSRRLESVVSLFVSAQQPDGYLNSHFIVVEPDKRWTNLRDCHELYCAGHLIEAAVAHFQATGKRTLLDCLCRYADYIESVFGRAKGRKRGYCGHEEIELALVKLYRATGRTRYLKLAKYFVDERGRAPHYFDQEARARGEDPAKSHQARNRYDYYQAHKPVRQQREVVGHAVRAMYLYTAMADLAAEYGDAGLRRACERLFEHVTRKRMYLTGGLGPNARNEGFSTDYDLPNESAYAETCAAIGLVFWMHRMMQLTGDAKYADVLERALYNGVLSGASLDGRKFFYVNPLESAGRHHRQDWFGCACCPPNFARLIASLGEYAYSQSVGAAYVHLYVQGSASLDLGGRRVDLEQRTRYPWDGRVRLTVRPRRNDSRRDGFTLALRIPGWCRGARLEINGQAVKLNGRVVRGYARITREWSSGDCVTLDLPMPVERIEAAPQVRADCGRVALQRGPIVYCFEEVDNGPCLADLALPERPSFRVRFEPDLLGGVATIAARARRRKTCAWHGELYRPLPSESGAPAPAGKPARASWETVPIKAVPYCVWDNRAAGEMQVWLRQE